MDQTLFTNTLADIRAAGKGRRKATMELLRLLRWRCDELAPAMEEAGVKGRHLYVTLSVEDHENGAYNIETVAYLAEMERPLQDKTSKKTSRTVVAIERHTKDGSEVLDTELVAYVSQEPLNINQEHRYVKVKVDLDVWSNRAWSDFEAHTTKIAIDENPDWYHLRTHRSEVYLARWSRKQHTIPRALAVRLAERFEKLVEVCSGRTEHLQTYTEAAINAVK